MMNRFRILFFLVGTLFLSCSSSSGSSSGDAIDIKISCSVEKIEVPAEGGSFQVTVVASKGGWSTEENKASDGYWWMEVSSKNTDKTMGTVTINVVENTDKNPRQGVVDVKLGDKVANILISQAAKTVTPIDGGEMVIPDGYKLTWNDEFNEGTELGSADWRHEVQKDHWVNNELQNYVNGSAAGKWVTKIADGRLYIQCFKGSDGKVYSARVYAHENEGWKYGIFEARIKLPKGKGTWPAFWMMPANNDYSANPWPLCGEIDIMEEVGADANITSSSLHTEAYNHTKKTQKTAERLTEGAEDGFHVYRLEWTEDYIKTYVDDNLLLSFDNDHKGDVTTWPFDKNFFVILNLAWGGDWGGYKGADESALPATMEVDYVRVFQKK